MGWTLALISGVVTHFKSAESSGRLVAHPQSEYHSGDQLPTEDALVQRFQVSRITGRRAIQKLVVRGLLEIRGELGIFVLSPRIEAEISKLKASSRK
jgi:GntR family transcriptional regulator